MTSASQRTALAALDAARPVIARLDASRHSEDVAADLIEGWSAVETALRSLVGGSSLSGQALVRELRNRQLLTLEQAHALLEFQAARDRAQRTDYRPSPADMNAARDGFLKLESGLMTADRAVASAAAAPLTPLPGGAPGGAAATMPTSADAVGGARGPRRWGMLTWITAAVLLAAVLGAGAWWFLATRESALDRGIAHLSGGRREAAKGEFSKAARDEPNDADPHIFLGRMAREEGDAMTARRELETAIRLEPTNAAAQREMGALLFSLGNYELARRFYVRAVQLNPEDRSAMGALGCSLVRLGQFDAGMRFIQRAGQGPWTACAAAPPAPPPS